MGETISKLRRIVYGEPLSDQAIAELDEARRQVDQALAAFDKGLGSAPSTMEVRAVLVVGKRQLEEAKASLQAARTMGHRSYSKDDPGYKEYELNAELGVHRVREAITNLKDVLRMIGAPE